MILRVFRWVCVAVLPVPPFLVVVFVSQIIIMRMAGMLDAEISGTWISSMITVLANLAGGHVVPWIAAYCAPSGRFVAGVAWSSVMAVLTLWTLVGNICAANGWFIATNVGLLVGLVIACIEVYCSRFR